MSVNSLPTGPPGNGGPPSNYELDRRLTVLETRFDTILPTLATKQDLQELRSEIQLMFAEQRREMESLRSDLLKTLNDTLKWMIAVAITLFIGMFVINFAMWNTVKNALDSNQRAAATRQGSVPPALNVPQTANEKRAKG